MNLALFDFDGTITTKEMFRPLLDFVTSPRRLKFAKLALLPLAIAYKFGFVSGTRARKSAVRFCFSGISAVDFEAACQRFSEQVLPQFLRQEALDRINWHRARGDKIVIVSGGIESYLKPWCNKQKIDFICSSLEYKHGVLTGNYIAEECTGKEKIRRIQKQYDLSAFPVIYAYGDSKEDMPMLGLAHKKFYRWQELIT